MGTVTMEKNGSRSDQYTEAVRKQHSLGHDQVGQLQESSH